MPLLPIERPRRDRGDGPDQGCGWPSRCDHAGDASLRRQIQDGLRCVISGNFGPRPVPYPGFLVLPSEEVPPGFQEVSHHYTKQEYRINLRQTRNDDRIDLDIFESPITQFSYSQSELVREFDYQGITGRVYAHVGKGGKETTLVWLNPPRQRISISLTQSVGDDYSPDDIIRVLKSMKPATGTP